MVFVGIFMMPFYYGSRARSVPEYLRLRFDEKTRGLNAISFAIMTIFSSGISMYAIAKLIQTLHVFDGVFQRLGLNSAWIFDFAIIISAIVVLVYTFLGGLSSAIYNEVLQFFLIVAGFLPLSYLGLKNVGGWSGLKAGLGPSYTHSGAGLRYAHTNRLGVEWVGLSMGLALAVLLASFMYGMAGNVPAFNPVWTYDIYQSYIRPGATDAHYLWMGRASTVFGIAFSIAAAYMANRFNNIMDMLQLVFAFVNAPLFATFLLGMFWKRTTGHAAFTGLLAGTAAAAIHHGLTLPAGADVGIKGGWLAVTHTYPSEMAQNFWTAIYAWSTCFVVTIIVSLITRAPEESKLVGLVYSLTPKPEEEPLAWYARPASLAIMVLAGTVLLNIIFW